MFKVKVKDREILEKQWGKELKELGGMFFGGRMSSILDRIAGKTFEVELHKCSEDCNTPFMYKYKMKEFDRDYYGFIEPNDVEYIYR